MAIINFPPTAGEPTDGSFTYTFDGVIYSWTGSYWSANSQSGLNNHYVEVAGDNMTGDLTLGTDKITLDATAGSANFAGNVNIGEQSLGSATGAAGILEVADGRIYTQIDGSTAANTVDALRIYHGTDVNATIRADGSASFAGSVTTGDGVSSAVEQVGSELFVGSKACTLTLQGDNPSNTANAFNVYKTSANRTVEIGYDGSASFAGGDASITAAGALVSNSQFRLTGDESPASPGVTIRDAAATKFLYTATKDGSVFIGNTSDSGANYQTGGLANANITLNAGDGSASFAGRVDSASGFKNTGDYGFNSFSDKTGPVISINNAAGNSPKVTVNNDGSAVFKGAVQTAGGVVTPSMVLQLEADDDTKYTATTDSEGNETRVYNGEVLDVKDRLTKADTALQSLKSAAAAATDFASLQSAIATALANI